MAKILFINSDDVQGIFVQRVLEHERNDEVILCDPSHQKPIETVVKEKPEMILIELMLMDTDPFQLCQKFKTLAETKDIPILFWRVTFWRKFIPIAQEHGVAGYLENPVGFRDLVEARDIVLAGGKYYPHTQS